MDKKTLIQVSKFLSIGVVNTAVDLSILNVLIIATSNHSLPAYGLFKSVSFTAGAVNSYFFNKYWTFKHPLTQVSNHTAQRLRFAMVSIASLIINTSVASTVYALLTIAYPTTNASISGSLGGISGTLVGLVWNFFAFKMFVFRSGRVPSNPYDSAYWNAARRSERTPVDFD